MDESTFVTQDLVSLIRDILESIEPEKLGDKPAQIIQYSDNLLSLELGDGMKFNIEVKCVSRYTN